MRPDGQYSGTYIWTGIQNEAASAGWEQELVSSDRGRKKAERTDLPLPEALPFTGRTEPLYPSLALFGSLDITELPPQALSLLDDFFSAAAEGKTSSSFFNPARAWLASSVSFELKELPPLSSWRYGRPFADADGVVEIPVRAYGSGFTCDTRVFLVPDGQGQKRFYIDQIYFGEVVSD